METFARAGMRASQEFCRKNQFLGNLGVDKWNFCGRMRGVQGNGVEKRGSNEVRWRRKATLAACNGGRANNVTA